MKTLLRALVLSTSLSALALSACGTTSANNGAVVASAADVLIGDWHDNDYVAYTFARVDGVVRVVSIVDKDNEVFEVRESGLDGDVFQLTYYVPSTEYVVTIRLYDLARDEVPATWTNSGDDSGEELFTRID